MAALQIGLIGYGDFTRLMCEQLAPYGAIIVSSRRQTHGPAHHGAQFAPLEAVLQADVIIPSFPSQFFADFFAAHGSSVRADALVVDVCSVKVKPLAVLEAQLPPSVQIIGTHPLFGPASVAKNNGLTGLRIAVSRVRASDEHYQRLLDFFANVLGLRVIEKTPQQHDRDMAYVQGLSHYIGRVMDMMDIPQTELATFAYEDLLDMRMIQGSDSWELFMSIMRDNPYALEVNQQFHQVVAALDERLR